MYIMDTYMSIAYREMPSASVHTSTRSADSFKVRIGFMLLGLYPKS